jgi:hypothetical protein
VQNAALSERSNFQVLLCRWVLFFTTVVEVLVKYDFQQPFLSKSERKRDSCRRCAYAKLPQMILQQRGAPDTSRGVRIFIIHPSGAAIKKAAAPRINT